MSVRVVPERALGTPFTVAFVIPDANERHLVTVGNGVMIHEKGATDAADATLEVPRLALIGMVGGQLKAIDLLQAGKIKIAGDPEGTRVLQRNITRLQQRGVGFCTPNYFLFQMRLDGHPDPVSGRGD
jgi:alkyl sulfatase BDS1-like metallo-beta-lactamase superfamily hydrolase